jgi:thioredoxin-related protein
MEQLETVQLSLWADTPVVTPSGERTTAKRWADELGLFYTPTLIIFDRNGNEIIRVDSVVQFYRLRNVLEYVLDEGYRHYATFQRWRESRRPRIYK